MEDTEVLCKVVLEAFGYTLDLNAPSHRVAVDKVRTELREGKASPKSHDNRVEAAQLILAANGVYGEAQKLNVLSFVVNSPLDVYEGVSQIGRAHV